MKTIGSEQTQFFKIQVKTLQIACEEKKEIWNKNPQEFEMPFVSTAAEMQMEQGFKFKGKTANATFLFKFWGRFLSPGTWRACQNNAIMAR